MPLTISHTRRILINLGIMLDAYTERHNKEAPKNGELPVGGGEWMDTFFRMEALRGACSALRNGWSIDEAIGAGQMQATVAVLKWNDRVSYHIRRWEKTCDEFIRNAVLSAVRTTRKLDK